MIEQIPETSHRILEQSARMLANAFQNDPLFRHALPGEPRGKEPLTALFLHNLKYGAKFGEIYSIHRQGLAVWLPPGNCRITTWRSLRAGMWLTPLKVGLKALLRLGRLHSITELLHQRYAPDPHWYLFILGVDPTSQGQGLGGRLLQPVLARADAAHLPCYLETYNLSTVRFYQKHGFDIAARHQIIMPSLYLWVMRRESG